MKKIMIAFVIAFAMATGVSAQSISTLTVPQVEILSPSSLNFHLGYTGLVNPANNTYARVFYGITIVNLFTNSQFLPAGDGTFVLFLSGLTPGAHYHYQAKVTYPFTFDGDSGSFTMPTCMYTLSTTGTDTICPGGSSALSANLGGSYVSPTYAWTPATGLSSTTVSNPTASPTSTTTYTVTVSDQGCTSSATAKVTVLPAPTVTASVTGNNPICSGTSTTLHAGGSGSTSWTWIPATGLNDPTLQNPTANPTSTTTYTVSGSNGACASTAATTVTVSGSITFLVTPSSADVCPGSTTTTFTASGATTYQWSHGLGTNPSVTVSPVVTTTYSVTGTAGACVASETVTVNVNSVSVNGGSGASICPNGSVQLNASGATTYSWSPATGLSNPTIANPIATPAATTTYTVTGTTAGCSSSTTVTVTVLTSPNVTLNANPLTVCNGDPSTLTGGGASTYVWDNGLGTGNSKVVYPTVPTIYHVTGTASNGCSNTAFVAVAVNPVPDLVTNPTSAVICSGGSIWLGISGASSYTWSPTTGLFPFIGSTVQASPSASITYTITGTTNGCSSTATVPVTVASPPTISSVTYYPAQQMLIINGPNFAVPIEIVINGVVYNTTTQNTVQAVFYSIPLNDSDEVQIQAIGTSSCYTSWTYYSTVGMVNTEEANNVAINQGETIALFDLSGRLITEIVSDQDYLIKDLFKVERLFTSLSAGCYFWHSATKAYKFVR